MSPNPNIQDTVLAKIHSGSVSMRPRSYFVRRALLIGGGVLLVFLVSLFFLSFVFFSIIESHGHFLLGFGSTGILTFLALFPWGTVLFGCILLVAIELVLRQVTKAYRLSRLQLYSLLVVGAVAASAIIVVTPFHRMLLGAADAHHLPFIAPWYEQVHGPHTDHGVFRGAVTNISTSSFVISHNDTDQDEDDGQRIVLPPQDFDLHSLSIGQRVYVAGTMAGGVVHAFGVRSVPHE